MPLPALTGQKPAAVMGDRARTLTNRTAGLSAP